MTKLSLTTLSMRGGDDANGAAEEATDCATCNPLSVITSRSDDGSSIEFSFWLGSSVNEASSTVVPSTFLLVLSCSFLVVEVVLLVVVVVVLVV